MDWIEEKISAYYSWLKDNTDIREHKETGWFSVSTPFVGLFNDNIEIYVKKEKDKVVLSDDGETLTNLAYAGVDVFRSTRRNKHLQKILLNYGVEIDGKELYVRADSESAMDFSQKKHSLLLAIMSVSDMDVLARENVKSIFSEDVQTFLEENGFTYTPEFILRGKSGLDTYFDFHIAGRKGELFINTFSSLKQNNVEAFLFGIGDTRDRRENQSNKTFNSLAIVNDTDIEPSEKLLSALKEYGTSVLKWSEREKKSDVFHVA